MKTLRDFAFFLDAYLYCIQNKIDQTKIVKKNFRVWNIKGVYE